MHSANDSIGRVLLVDDDDAVVRDYGRLLRRLNLLVQTASNGRDALERLTAGRFDVVVVDVAMPGSDGLALLRTIREREPDLPVILVTGGPSLQTAVKAVEYGATQYLIKPVESDALGEAVWRAVDTRRAARLRLTARLAAENTGAAAQARDARGCEFEKTLASLSMAFQPIVRPAERRVVAYEALLRVSDRPFQSPLELFDTAARLGRVHSLGRAIRSQVAKDAATAPPEVLLFVNITAEELSDNELLSNTAPLSQLAGRVVLEITERSALHVVSGVSTRLARLRKLGYRIAVDHLGEGYAGLSSVSQLEPEFVKLDRSLIHGVHQSSRKLSLVRGIAQACSRDLGIQVVCEGIEQREQQDALEQLGLDVFQGYLFARPEPGFAVPAWLI